MQKDPHFTDEQVAMINRIIEERMKVNNDRLIYDRVKKNEQTKLFIKELTDCGMAEKGLKELLRRTINDSTRAGNGGQTG